MEYISGGELYDFIISNEKVLSTKSQLPEDKARHFFQQIISGVSYCHAHMVVHRDLKPENLLLDKNNNVRIADFGLSNMMKDGHFMETSCGSPNYAAPEVISGKLYAGPEVDVWSCGVILYALLSGYLPFDDANIKELFRKIKCAEYSPLQDVSEEVNNLIARMLEVDPLKRISLEEIAEDEWFKKDLPPDMCVITKTAYGRTEEEIDEEVMQLVIDMGYDKDLLTEALKMGPDLLTKPLSEKKQNEQNDSKMQEMRQIAVAYHLLTDQHRKKNMKRSKSTDKKEKTPEKPFVEEQNSAKIETLNEGVSARAFFQRVGHGGLKSGWQNVQNTLPEDLHNSSWALGIRCSAHPPEIMRRVFMTMKNIGMEWKILSPYRIKARLQKKEPEESLRIGIQIYNNANFAQMHLSKTVASVVQSTNSAKWKMYTIDVQLLDGDLISFLNIFDRIQFLLNDEK